MMSESKESNETNSSATVKTLPRSLNHIGISVPDIDAAMAWYRDVLGFTVLSAPRDIIIDNSTHIGSLVGQIYGPTLEASEISSYVSSEWCWPRIFQFIDPPTQVPHIPEGANQKFEYIRGGFFHICITDPNPEDLARRIAETGGQQISPVLNVFEGEIYRCVYCLDPYGNVIELLSASYERVLSNRDPKVTNTASSPATTA